VRKTTRAASFSRSLACLLAIERSPCLLTGCARNPSGYTKDDDISSLRTVTMTATPSGAGDSDSGDYNRSADGDGGDECGSICSGDVDEGKGHQEEHQQQTTPVEAPLLINPLARAPSLHPGHSFKVHTFTSPTYCDVCESLLVGFFSQGLRCDKCGTNVHRACRSRVDADGGANNKASTICDPTPLMPNSWRYSVSSIDARGTTKTTSGASTSDDEGEFERAHVFREHTYTTPTHCDICAGLLVGLWSQGLQCRTCKMNVHRGAGLGEHDDCRAEALSFSPCKVVNPTDIHNDHSSDNQQQRHSIASSLSGRTSRDEERKRNSFARAVREVKELAANPNFFSDLKQQVDNDIAAMAKNVVVSKAVEDERQKNLRRLKERIVLPLITYNDKIEAHGEIYCLLVLLAAQAALAAAASVTALAWFMLAVLLRHGTITIQSFRVALLHESTNLATIHVLFLFIAVVVRKVACAFKRKTIIIHQFIRDIFGIDTKKDIGVSVIGVAMRLMRWSRRLFLSTAITSCIAIAFWFAMQPTVDTLQLLGNASNEGGIEQVCLSQANN